MSIRHIVTLLAAFAAVPAFAADNLEGITLSPNPAKVGQPVKITVTGDTDPAIYCGLLTGFGDGTDERSMVGGKEGPFPKTATHSYAAPGTYTVRADGRKVGDHLGCTGKIKVQLVVEAAPAPAPVAAPAAKTAATAAIVCPEGYKLKGKAGKKGDFKCTAGKGAKAPEKVMSCADGLEYFQTKTTLGCRKTAKK